MFERNSEPGEIKNADQVSKSLFSGPEFDVRINPDMAKLPYGYTYLIIKGDSFVIGDYNTLVRSYRPQDGDKIETFETDEAAQRAAYDYVQELLRVFSERVPYAFPTDKTIMFQVPDLRASII